MRQSAILALLALMVVSAGDAFADGNANFILGGRDNRDDEFWGGVGFAVLLVAGRPVEPRGVFGVNVDFGGQNWPVNLMAGLHVSADVQDAGVFTNVAAVADLTFGAVWMPMKGKNVRPYLGGGLASVGVIVDFDFVDDSDQSFGWYANGGVFFRLGKKFNIGIDARILRGTELRVFGTDFNADYDQLGMILGFGW